VFLGRFDDALASFTRADRYDTPPVSRWTWTLGAGWACLLMGRNEEAVQWLQRSIAITPASGRSHMLLAVALHRLGRPVEAKAAFSEGMRLRPGSTAANVPAPEENTSPTYRAQTKSILQTMIEIGLPPG
jgi:tetratricopeptide (TPR) repeat protein